MPSIEIFVLAGRNGVCDSDKNKEERPMPSWVLVLGGL